MARHVVVAVQCELVEQRTGLWCAECNLPSGADLTVAMTIGQGATRLGAIRRCLDCGGDAVS